jgi:hypothetical protein
MAERLEQERLEQKRRQGELHVEREEWRTKMLQQGGGDLVLRLSLRHRNKQRGICDVSSDIYLQKVHFSLHRMASMEY